MKILITGAGGMLGYDVCMVLGQQAFPTTRKELDVTDPVACMAKIGAVRPDAVVHCAAFTDVDGCEANPAVAFQVNALGTANIALATLEFNIPLLYLSTDYVFDGKKTKPYVELDLPNPIGTYGRSKWEGEEFVRDHLSRYYIVRTSWLFGKNGRNFARTILRLARQKVHTGEPIRVVEDQVGSPTYTLDLASAIKGLLETGFFGIYHITNQSSCSWHQFACEILKEARLDIPVESITSADLGRLAPRPANSVLSNHLWNARGFAPLRPYREALKDYLADIKNGY